MFSFPKSRRILKRKHFEKVRNFSKRLVGRSIVVNAARRGWFGYARIGIVVTRRFGRACKRNRFKRIVREACRLNLNRLPAGMDIIIRPVGKNYNLSAQDVERDLIVLFS